MRDASLRLVLDATFRSNPRYEVCVFDRLEATERRLLADLESDPQLYGILRPRDAGGLAVKSLSCDAALLFLTMSTPGRLPAFVKRMFGARANEQVAQLVLDAVLEVEIGGRFVSGSESHGALFAERADTDARGRIGALSMAALRYGQALAVHEATRLSARLYFYNRLPATLQWRERFPGEAAVLERLGCPDGRLRGWQRVAMPPGNDGWIVWQSTRSNPDDDSRAQWKLYVSPMPEHLREAFDTAAHVLSRSECPRFKTGRDAFGILRPDKLVAYFASFEALSATADALGKALKGTPAHGVPFTSAVTSDGLLSWGMDPPRAEHVLTWQERPSWRLWLTHRLATAILLARDARANSVEPWRFALDRLRLDGVDTDSWTPNQALWNEESATR